MALTDSLSKSSFRTSTFDCLLCGRIRLETAIGGLAIELSLGEGLNLSSQGTHGSNHISMDMSFPTIKQAPLDINSFAFLMDCHIGEAYLTSSFLNQPFLTLYLLLSAFKQRLSFTAAIIQVNLEMSALLKSLVCLNPSPPFLLV